MNRLRTWRPWRRGLFVVAGAIVAILALGVSAHGVRVYRADAQRADSQVAHRVVVASRAVMLSAATISQFNGLRVLERPDHDYLGYVGLGVFG